MTDKEAIYGGGSNSIIFGTLEYWSVEHNVFRVTRSALRVNLLLEVVSKPQIRFKGKAQADRESAAYMGM